MLGKTHILVANISLACLNQKERHILYPRWGAIEAGATLSDELKIMWEPEAAGFPRQLVHRCYVDSTDIKNHGCVTRAWDHAEGSISFIKDYYRGELDGSWNEIEFLEDLGMFIGIASHHIADLCTPVHVGHKINYNNLGFDSLKKFHNQVEKDILRYQHQNYIKFPKPRIINISKRYFWKIAKTTYNDIFLKLEGIYNSDSEDSVIEMASHVICNAVMHTVNIWRTILHRTEMTKRKWSYQPLI